MSEEPDCSGSRIDALLPAASSGAVGGLTAMYVWEIFTVPGVVPAAAAAMAGMAVRLLPVPRARS